MSTTRFVCVLLLCAFVHVNATCSFTAPAIPNAMYWRAPSVAWNSYVGRGVLALPACLSACNGTMGAVHSVLNQCWCLTNPGSVTGSLPQYDSYIFPGNSFTGLKTGDYLQVVCTTGVVPPAQVCGGNGVVGPVNVSCTCAPGYIDQGNGQCLDINECATANGGCTAPLGTCHNTPGSFVCGCPNGFEVANAACQDVNECASNNGGCSWYDDCINEVGSYACDGPAESFKRNVPWVVVACLVFTMGVGFVVYWKCCRPSKTPEPAPSNTHSGQSSSAPALVPEPVAAPASQGQSSAAPVATAQPVEMASVAVVVPVTEVTAVPVVHATTAAPAFDAAPAS